MKGKAVEWRLALGDANRTAAGANAVEHIADTGDVEGHGCNTEQSCSSNLGGGCSSLPFRSPKLQKNSHNCHQDLADMERYYGERDVQDMQT